MVLTLTLKMFERLIHLLLIVSNFCINFSGTKMGLRMMKNKGDCRIMLEGENNSPCQGEGVNPLDGEET